MKLSLASAAVAATTVSALPSMLPRQDTTGRVLITNNGHIYLANYDGSSFEITMTGDDSGHSPSWVSFVEPDLLYAVDEWSNLIRRFKLDVAGDSLDKEPLQVNGSSGVVHLEFNKDHTRMVGAAYGGGMIDIWDVSDGGLKLLKSLPSDDPLGPNTERQAAPHPHQSVLDPSGRFFAVNDLGTDHILLIDSESDYDIVSHIPLTPAGAGPRHGAFYPRGADKATHYMVLCEIKNLIVVYELTYTDSTIEFKQIQEVSSFGPDAKPAAEAAAGELAIIGDHVYISNRLTGADTDDISHFAITKCGTTGAVSLKFSDSASTGGTLPRMFSASSSGKELLVGNQGGALGLVALGIKEDGSLEKEPRASVKAAEFGTEENSGPMFVKQISA